MPSSCDSTGRWRDHLRTQSKRCDVRRLQVGNSTFSFGHEILTDIAGLRALLRAASNRRQRLECLLRYSRWLGRLGGLKSKKDQLPLDLGLLEIDQKTASAAGGLQVVEALRGMFIGESLRAF